MEQAYWLGRKRTSLKMAQNAESSQAKMIHYDLAGRYSLKASSAKVEELDLASAMQPSISAP